MPSCNNNSNVTRIYVDNGCNPCNPCTSCNRCTCDCTCDQPDYNTGGCITIQPTDCIKYNGPAIPFYNIATNDSLTKVIQDLAGTTPPLQIQSQPEPEEQPLLLSPTPIVSNEELQRYTETQYATVVNQIDHVKDRIKKEGLASSIKVEGDGIIEAEFKAKKLSMEFNFGSFLEGLIDFIHADPTNAAKLAQVINFIQGNKDEFVLYPYDVNLESTEDTIRVTWTAADNVDSYNVFYKNINDGDFIKAGNTPALGLTIPNLESGVEYQIYIVSIGTNGFESIASPIESIQTK